MLKEIFLALLNRYTNNLDLATKYWQELEKKYAERNRHYHTIAHLQNLYAELLPVKNLIEDWDAVLFALFYHDSIYNPQRKDNEEKSAALLIKRLNELNCPVDFIKKAEALILATKSHQFSASSDSNLFTDADLSILGKEETVYLQYCAQVRKEYAIYPDFLYKPGRKKVLNHFLSMPRIFKTLHFFNLYEEQARQNLQQEASLL